MYSALIDLFERFIPFFIFILCFGIIRSSVSFIRSLFFDFDINSKSNVSGEDVEYKDYYEFDNSDSVKDVTELIEGESSSFFRFRKK